MNIDRIVLMRYLALQGYQIKRISMDTGHSQPTVRKYAGDIFTHTTVVIGDFNSRYAAMLSVRPEVK